MQKRGGGSLPFLRRRADEGIGPYGKRADVGIRPYGEEHDQNEI